MPIARVAAIFVCLVVWSFPRPLAAQSPAASATSAASSQGDDNDAALVPAEPDFRVINLPTTMRLPKFKGHFNITHRFLGNFRRGSFSDQAARLFGIDDGAVVGFEYRFGIARHVEVAAFRTASARTLQLYGKWDGIRQSGALPVSASVVVSVEGADNFQEQYAPAVAVSVSRRFGERAAFYVVPTFVHNTAAILGADQNTTFVGLGARLRIRPTVYVAAEASPRVSGYTPGETQFGFAIEKRAGGHMFQLNVTNGSGTTLAQVARGGQPMNLGLGFNLSRKFY
jgi:uncharacterized beta barrel domain-containing protein DUF5777